MYEKQNEILEIWINHFREFGSGFLLFYFSFNLMIWSMLNL